MTLRLVLRALAARPVRFAVLACGFGFGIAVMAALLGVGDVILEQAKDPALGGGGELVLTGASETVDNARFVLSSVLGRSPLAERIRVASPAASEVLYLVQGGTTTPLRATGGIPSLEKSLGDPESLSPEWTDTEEDRTWVKPDPADLLAAMDRFHAIPDVPERADSWAEWWYFNGRSRDGATRFYLTFLAGPRAGAAGRSCIARLQLLRGDLQTSYSRHLVIEDGALFGEGRSIRIAESEAVLDGLRYEISLDLPAEIGRSRASGSFTLDAPPGRSIPPLTLEGAKGWISGYVVPVLSGPMRGALRVDGETIPLDGFTGYHDHNWGFWRGVTWQWGQVAHDDLSILYGKVSPPADAADATRMPVFVGVLGPDGPLAFSRNGRIDEEDAPGENRPATVRVRAAEGDLLSLDVTFTVEDAIRNRSSSSPLSNGGATTFLQLRGVYHVHGKAAGHAIDFEAPGSAETFRGE